MGRDLHYSIVPYFEKVLQDHSSVKMFQRIDSDTTDDHYVYRVERHNKIDVVVQLSDAYCFTDADYWSKSKCLDSGGVICIIKPEASDVFERKQINGKYIIIGKLNILMGALNKDDFWNYKPKDERN